MKIDFFSPQSATPLMTLPTPMPLAAAGDVSLWDRVVATVNSTAVEPLAPSNGVPDAAGSDLFTSPTKLLNLTTALGNQTLAATLGSKLMSSASSTVNKLTSGN